MKTRFLWLAAAICAAGAQGRERAVQVPLAVSVFNDAEVPPAVLEAARQRASLILEDAGVALSWIDCGSPGHRAHAGCSAITFPTHLSVRLLARAPAASEDTFGRSFLDDRQEGSYAYVYTHALSASRFRKLVDQGDLLGYMIAHELGHLLLGRDSHAAGGLMTAVWQSDELQAAGKGNLFFSAREKAKIRQRYLVAAARPEPARSAGDSGR